MNRDYPDSPEAVALELWRQIREAEEKDEPQRGRNRTTRAELLWLYAECLAATTNHFSEASDRWAMH